MKVRIITSLRNLWEIHNINKLFKNLNREIRTSDKIANEKKKILSEGLLTEKLQQFVDEKQIKFLWNIEYHLEEFLNKERQILHLLEKTRNKKLYDDTKRLFDLLRETIKKFEIFRDNAREQIKALKEKDETKLKKLLITEYKDYKILLENLNSYGDEAASEILKIIPSNERIERSLSSNSPFRKIVAMCVLISMVFVSYVKIGYTAQSRHIFKNPNQIERVDDYSIPGPGIGLAKDSYNIAIDYLEHAKYKKAEQWDNGTRYEVKPEQIRNMEIESGVIVWRQDNDKNPDNINKILLFIKIHDFNEKDGDLYVKIKVDPNKDDVEKIDVEPRNCDLRIQRSLESSMSSEVIQHIKKIVNVLLNKLHDADIESKDVKNHSWDDIRLDFDPYNIPKGTMEQVQDVVFDTPYSNDDIIKPDFEKENQDAWKEPDFLKDDWR